jgi:hypothetical protein
METTRLYELRGGAGDILAILTSVPCHECPEARHPRVPSSSDFRTKLTEAVFGGAFPSTRPKRFGKTVCFACGKRLKKMSSVADRLEATLAIDGAEMTLTLTAPSIECPHCGCRQLEATAHVSDGVRKALDALLTRGRFRA